MRIGFLIYFIVSAALAGCATFSPMPYQPSVDGGYGYNDKRIGRGEYRITVSGNAATSAQLLWEQLQYRAAEIALAHRHDYFVVAPYPGGRLVNIEPAFLMAQFGAGPLVQYCNRDDGYINYSTDCYPVGVEPSRQLIATATVTFSDANRPGAKNVFNAKEVKHRLESRIGRPARGGTASNGALARPAYSAAMSFAAA